MSGTEREALQLIQLIINIEREAKKEEEEEEEEEWSAQISKQSKIFHSQSLTNTRDTQQLK
jgi:hypothetical protein